MVQDKFEFVTDLRKNTNFILVLISTLINTKFTVVDYDNEDRLGEEIEINLNMICKEYLDYLSNI